MALFHTLRLWLALPLAHSLQLEHFQLDQAGVLVEANFPGRAEVGPGEDFYWRENLFVALLVIFCALLSLTVTLRRDLTTMTDLENAQRQALKEAVDFMLLHRAEDVIVEK